MHTTSWEISAMMVLCGYIPESRLVFDNDNVEVKP
jgi:hypothetical protein